MAKLANHMAFCVFSCRRYEVLFYTFKMNAHGQGAGNRSPSPVFIVLNEISKAENGHLLTHDRAPVPLLTVSQELTIPQRSSAPQFNLDINGPEIRVHLTLPIQRAAAKL